MTLLGLSEVSRTYTEGDPVYALRQTTVDIAEGEYLAITGPSGSGKSTLLNVLGLLDAPTSGSYRVGGVETVGSGSTLRGAIRGQLFGFVFQAFHLLPGRTAAENVEIGMLYGPLRRRERRRRAVEALERVGLAHRTGADPRQLSGGERQRVAIARAVGGRPRHVFVQLLLETGLLGGLGGVAGALAGILTVSIVSLVNAWTPAIDLRAAAVACLASAAAGLLAGLVPAARAVRVPPVSALQRGSL